MAVFVFAILIVNICTSQNVPIPPQYPIGVYPKVKAKIDSLYPLATRLGKDYITQNPIRQAISLQCNCPETDHFIEIIFDTNGNIQSKNYFYLPIKDLPETIQTLVSIDTSYTPAYFRKNFDKKGVVTYLVYMGRNIDRGTGWTYWWYFNSSGKLISKERHCEYGLL